MRCEEILKDRGPFFFLSSLDLQKNKKKLLLDSHSLSEDTLFNQPVICQFVIVVAYLLNFSVASHTTKRERDTLSRVYSSLLFTTTT